MNYFKEYSLGRPPELGTNRGWERWDKYQVLNEPEVKPYPQKHQSQCMSMRIKRNTPAHTSRIEKYRRLHFRYRDISASSGDERKMAKELERQITFLARSKFLSNRQPRFERLGHVFMSKISLSGKRRQEFI